ncbi:hypothetical protein D5366_00385 [Neokomagataea tanensis]|uniref:Uncharacterized protein n=1 Tax=Neokomagataea tanensis TaxID=661191 RepID=A0A4Y6V659_9PROT|nr:hypothetical protein D5366_00385 [Neokomagataea tanensis]
MVNVKYDAVPSIEYKANMKPSLDITSHKIEKVGNDNLGISSIKSLLHRLEPPKGVAQRIESTSISPQNGNLNVRLVTDAGLEIRSLRTDGNFIFFMVPEAAQSVKIVPTAQVFPEEIMSCASISIGKIIVFCNRVRQDYNVHLKNKSLEGWAEIVDPEIRRTKGEAVLPLQNYNKKKRPLLIAIEIMGDFNFLHDENTQYLAQLTT